MVVVRLVEYDVGLSPAEQRVLLSVAARNRGRSSRDSPRESRGKMRMTSNHHALMSWATARERWPLQRIIEAARSSQSPKPVPVGWRVATGLGGAGNELLVIADQSVTVNTFPGLLHTRPSHHEGSNTRSRSGNPFGAQPPKVGQDIGVKS